MYGFIFLVLQQLTTKVQLTRVAYHARIFIRNFSCWRRPVIILLITLLVNDTPLKPEGILIPALIGFRPYPIVFQL